MTLPKLRLLCGENPVDAGLIAQHGRAHYSHVAGEIRLDVAYLLENPLHGVLGLLHEVGHAVVGDMSGPRWSRRAVLREEAAAWRYAVRQIRRLRPLTAAERDRIRVCYGSYVTLA